MFIDCYVCQDVLHSCYSGLFALSSDGKTSSVVAKGPVNVCVDIW